MLLPTITGIHFHRATISMIPPYRRRLAVNSINEMEDRISLAVHVTNPDRRTIHQLFDLFFFSLSLSPKCYRRQLSYSVEIYFSITVIAVTMAFTELVPYTTSTFSL